MKLRGNKQKKSLLYYSSNSSKTACRGNMQTEDRQHSSRYLLKSVLRYSFSPSFSSFPHHSLPLSYWTVESERHLMGKVKAGSHAKERSDRAQIRNRILSKGKIEQSEAKQGDKCVHAENNQGMSWERRKWSPTQEAWGMDSDTKWRISEERASQNIVTGSRP